MTAATATITMIRDRQINRASGEPCWSSIGTGRVGRGMEILPLQIRVVELTGRHLG
jgi:hypothetical protein